MARLRNHIYGVIFAVVCVGLITTLLPAPQPRLVGLVAFGAYLIGLAGHIWFRTSLYWYRRGTGGSKYWRCQSCDQRIYRMAGDWILHCKNCGWRPGYVGQRWLWHSVPAVEARRRISTGGIIRVSVAAVVIAGILVVAVAGPGILPFAQVNDTLDSLVDGAGRSAPQGTIANDNPRATATMSSQTSSVATATPTSTSISTRTATEELDRSAIERDVHREINDRRTSQGLSPLSFDTALREIARYHSKDMAQNDYFAHVTPGGESLSDRYERFGYECRVPTSGNRYLTGAENIAYTFAHQDIRRTDGTVVNFEGDEEAIAEGLVYQWMHSSGHRENILTPEWQREGIGIYIEDAPDGTRVYATQNFC